LTIVVLLRDAISVLLGAPDDPTRDRPSILPSSCDADQPTWSNPLIGRRIG
jgi:hypothetical protein